jgi:hypothetical protein
MQVKPAYPRKWKLTRGTETSKYPEEKKTISDSLSSGERTGSSPNREGYGLCGVVGLFKSLKLNENRLGRRAVAGESPLSERFQVGEVS